ncbi:unnamed protein product [Brassica oleracea var. botrytis]
MLKERYQVVILYQIEALYQYAKFQFECGNYSASEILMQNWDIALEELNRLKDIIDSKAPSETRKHFSKTIRALCNSDVKEGFVFGNDTSLPETYVRDPKKPLSNIGGKSASKRPTVAFFAGQPDHGYVRPILLSYWGNNKDPYLKIFGKLLRSKGNKNYLQFMKTSKYCICA